MCADSKEMCCLFVADVLVLRARLRFRGVAQSGNHAASDFLNEFLLRNSRKCRALVTEDASERFCDARSHSVDALLKANKFPLDL